MEDTKSKFMIDLLDALTGSEVLTRSTALAADRCSKCGGDAREFTNEVSKAEYTLTAWCQDCQNHFFGNP